MTVKFPDEIHRYDGDKAIGQPGWQTIVTPLQMLEEILRACANTRDHDEPGCTVSFGGEESQEEYDELSARMAAKGMEVLHERRRGSHNVGLWRREWRGPDEDELVNHCHTTFIFTTDPPDMFWDGI